MGAAKKSVGDFGERFSHFDTIMKLLGLTTVGFVAAQCPNESWELAENGSQCVPKTSEYKIECDPKFGLTISVNGGVLFDDESKIQSPYTGSYIRIGTCGGTQQVTHNKRDGKIEICFDVSGDIDAVTNPDGLVISRILSFKAQCSFDDHFSVQQQFEADLNQSKGGLVDHSAGSFGALFNLQFYHAETGEMGDMSGLTIGERAKFRVMKENAMIPHGLDYMIASCTASGPNDAGDEINYDIIKDQCYSRLVNAASGEDLKEFTYDVFAFGESDAAMVINLVCDVQLCAETCTIADWTEQCPTDYNKSMFQILFR